MMNQTTAPTTIYSPKIDRTFTLVQMPERGDNYYEVLNERGERIWMDTLWSIRIMFGR